MTFELELNYEGTTQTYQIDEPHGFDASALTIQQKDRGHARDVLFSETEVIFTPYRNHQFEKLVFLHQRRGFETEAFLIIKGLTETLRLELGFADAETDGKERFACRVIQDGYLQRLKRVEDIKIDVLSDKDMDGNPITPLVPQNILVKAKSVYQVSEWGSQPITESETLAASQYVTVNIFNSLLTSDIRDSTIPFLNFEKYGASNADAEKARDNATLVRAKTNLRNVQGEIKGLNLSVNSLSIQVRVRISVFYGTSFDFDDLQFIYLYNELRLSHSLVNKSYSFTIPEIPNTGVMGILISVINPLATGGSATNISVSASTVNDVSLTLTSNSVTYNTVVPSLRLYDVMKQCVLSAGLADIVETYYGPGKRFYNQRLLTGNFLRRKRDAPFYITLKDLLGVIIEQFADMEVQPDGKVFFGLEEEYYTNVEMAVLSEKTFEDYNQGFNPKLKLNRFEFNYKNFQSQKEIVVPNTEEGVHGESQWKLKNAKVENVLEVNCEAARDASLIESTIRDGLEQDSTSATQDDDKLFLIDCRTEELVGQYAQYFTETSRLEIRYIGDFIKTLTISEDENLNWEALGLSIGSQFEIQSTPHVGFYVITKITPSTLTLSSSGFYTTLYQGPVRYRYSVISSTLAGISWTNQGIITSGIVAPDKYANLRFTVKRNIYNFFQRRLAGANLYWKEDPVRNTYYKNNPNLVTTIEGVTLREGEVFIPQNPLISPVLHKDMEFIMTLDEFTVLLGKIRTQRGFVRAYDKDGLPIKFYIKRCEYRIAEGVLLISEGEEKYEPYIINIVKFGGDFVAVGDNYVVSRVLFDDKGEKIRLMDQENMLLYKPLFWNRIAVNGASPSSLNQLKEWLLLLI